MANRPSYGGFRWVKNKFAPDANTPPRVTLPIASAYGTSLGLGAPVKVTTDGTIQLAATNDPVYGIFDGMKQVYNASTGFTGPAPAYVATVTWGTNLSRQSLAHVIPVRGQVFRISVNDNTTATTQAAYEAFVQENCDFVAAAVSQDRTGHLLNISTHATTAEDCRIENVPDKSLTDFSATGVELDVSFNLIQDTASGSTTGT